MSEQIREQISAFLDGELPSSETELLLKRLARDAGLRETFGRHALIGEALRGKAPHAYLTRGFAARVNRTLDRDPDALHDHPLPVRASRWWRPLVGAAVAAGVAAVAVLALQQRAYTPTVQVAQSSTEALSYTVPVTPPETQAVLPAARLTNYVFAHSKYSSPLGRRNVLSGLIAEPDAPLPSLPDEPARVP